MLKTNPAVSSNPEFPDSIPTILLPESDTNGKLETYLQTGWHVVGKLSMADSSAVSDYVVLQPVHKFHTAQPELWQ